MNSLGVPIRLRNFSKIIDLLLVTQSYFKGEGPSQLPTRRSGQVSPRRRLRHLGRLAIRGADLDMFFLSIFIRWVSRLSFMYRRRRIRRVIRRLRKRSRFSGRSRRARTSLRRYQSLTTRNPITSDVFCVKLRYSEVRNFTGSSGFSTFFVYRGNGIRDPNFTGVGGSVSGAAQWFNFYSDCVVLGSKIKLAVVNGAAQMAQCCIYPNRTSNPVGTNLTDLREIPYGRTRTLQLYSTGAQNRPQHLSNYFSTAKMFCVSKQEIKDNSLYWHQQGTDPTSQWFWIMEVDWPASVTTSYVVDTTIIYYCMFKRRVNVQV